MRKGLPLLFMMIVQCACAPTTVTVTPPPTVRTPPMLPTRTPTPTITFTPPPTDRPVPTLTATPLPTPSIEDLAYRSVGYYPSWAISAHAFSPYSITANLLTHVIYAFGEIDLEDIDLHIC